VCRNPARPGPRGAATELDETYEREEPAADLAASADPAAGEPAQWIEYVTTHGMRRVRATLLLSGTELRVETNSEARLDRVLDVLRSLQPSLIVLPRNARPPAICTKR